MTVITLPNTVAHPWTMVIIPLDAIVADQAVLRTGWSKDVTRAAINKLCLLAAVAQNLLGLRVASNVQAFRKFAFNGFSARDDTRLCEPRATKKIERGYGARHRQNGGYVVLDDG